MPERRPRVAALAGIDLGLLVAAAGLSLIGILLTWSATSHTSGTAFAVRGAINVGVGVGLAALVLRMDPRTLRAAVPLFAAGAVLALLAVLSPIGSTINGSRSWIELPGFSLQPSEFAKVALTLSLAAVVADRPRVSSCSSGRGRRNREQLAWRDLRLALVVAAVPLALVMLQPDLGSALVLSSLAACALVVAGVSRGVLFTALGVAAAAVTVALTTPLLAGYQRDRLLAFLHPDTDPGGIGYQVAQVKLAIGSGGVFGQGLFQGRSTQGGFIPFQYTDFVFSVAGEELGLLGAAGVVALEMFLVARMVVVARSTTDTFTRVVCAAVAGWFLFQSVENIGMNLGLMPVTGVPLPFVSYGGSSMFSCWAAIGVVGNVQKAGRSRLG